MRSAKKRGIDDVYLLRLEQLYPFPLKALVAGARPFPHAEFVWCQEEPQNMGAWTFVEPYLEWVLRRIGAPSERPSYAGRPGSAATATGQTSQHLKQLQSLLNDALA